MAPVRKLKTARPRISDSENISTHTRNSSGKSYTTPTATAPSAVSGTPVAPKPRTKYRINTKAPNQPNQPHNCHIVELYSIWNLDQRVPTVSSRNAWALARNINASSVHKWFAKRKATLKKKRIRNGLTISDETYELPIGTPPIIKLEEEEEEEFASISYAPIKMEEEKPSVEDTSDFRSSPTSTLFDSDPLTPEFASASSDTSCSSPVRMGNSEKLDKRAYTLEKNRPPQTTNTEPIYLSGHKLSLKRSTINKSIPLFIPDSSQQSCSQDHESSASSFLCLLCTPTSEEPDSSDDDIHIFDSDPRLRETSYNTLQYDPDTSMELSAIPFLSRSPDYIPTPTLHCLTSWLEAFRSGFAYTDALDVYTTGGSRDSCLNGYSFDGFWLGACDDEVQSLVPIVDSFDGEPFDFLPAIEEPIDYEKLPMPNLLLVY